MVWPDAVMSSDSMFWIFAYYAIGFAVYFSLEHWNVEDTLYFMTQASFTVGFGDTVPHKPESKIFTAIYAPIGTLMMFHAALPQGRALASMVMGSPGTVMPASSSTSYLNVAKMVPGLLLVIGAGGFGAYKLFGFDYVDSFYFAASSATTQGYGDLGPHGRVQMIAMIPYMWVACGTFAALVEACYNTARWRMVQQTGLAKVVDQLLLQPSPWDVTVGGAPKAYASRADDGAGLSEAEFMLAALVGHGVVDVPTLVSLRRKYAQLMHAARQHDPRHARAAAAGGNGDGAVASAAEAGLAAAAGGGERLDARAVFAIGLSEHRVLQREAGQEPGATQEDAQRDESVRLTPIALVDLRAADGGFAEWYEHFWRKVLLEERAKVQEGAGSGGSDGQREMV